MYIYILCIVCKANRRYVNTDRTDRTGHRRHSRVSFRTLFIVLMDIVEVRCGALVCEMGNRTDTLRESRLA